MRTDYTTIAIPKPLAQNLKAYLKKTAFRSNSEFITFLIREVLGGSTTDIKEKLKKLGY